MRRSLTTTMVCQPDSRCSGYFPILSALIWYRLHTTRKPMKQPCHRWSLRRVCWTKRRDLILSPIQRPVQVQKQLSSDHHLGPARREVRAPLQPRSNPMIMDHTGAFLSTSKDVSSTSPKPSGAFSYIEWPACWCAGRGYADHDRHRIACSGAYITRKCSS
jgi:hypothetical protein